MKKAIRSTLGSRFYVSRRLSTSVHQNEFVLDALMNGTTDVMGEQLDDITSSLANMDLDGSEGWQVRSTREPSYTQLVTSFIYELFKAACARMTRVVVLR